MDDGWAACTAGFEDSRHGKSSRATRGQGFEWNAKIVHCEEGWYDPRQSFDKLRDNNVGSLRMSFDKRILLPLYLK
jgi:hypothetical protein